MKLIKAAQLAEALGVNRRTMSRICKATPDFASLHNGDYYIDLEELAKRPGFDLITALMLPTRKWRKAIDLAREAGIPRETMAYWCRYRPRFAIRLGRVWYIDVEAYQKDA